MRVFAALLITCALWAEVRAQTVPASDVNARRENQQDRIANGVQDGQLTPGETTRLERQEAGLNGEIHADRNANGGRLTPAERRQVNGQQNRLSGEIYNDKHNAAVEHYGKNEVGARRDLQQQRIANGIRSGQLTPHETAGLERGESRINREVGRDRAANGGTLTRGERAAVNRQQNRESARIFVDKHNGRRAPR